MLSKLQQTLSNRYLIGLFRAACLEIGLFRAACLEIGLFRKACLAIGLFRTACFAVRLFQGFCCLPAMGGMIEMDLLQRPDFMIGPTC